jgi:ATPase family associated with various cellular activities (AAA)
MFITNIFNCSKGHSSPNTPPLSQKMAAGFIPYYTMNNNLHCIKKKVNSNPVYVLNKEELAQVKEAFINCNNLFAEKLLNNLTQLPLDTVKKAISMAFETNDDAKIMTSLNRFLESLDENHLIEFSGSSKERLNQTLDKNVLLRDKALNSVLKNKGKAIWKELYTETSYFCHHLIQMFIAMTGYNEIGGGKANRYGPSEANSYEAKAKIEFYLTLLGYPSLLFASAFALIGSAALAGITTAVIVACSILFIPIYMRYLKPCPNQVTGLDNLNQKILRNESPLFERADALNSIEDAFCSGKGVIIYGEPGAGKTSIADSLAALIVAKKAKEGAEFLNDAQMFSVNANQFKGYGFDSVSFQSLSDQFGDFNKSFVLFIDEIASLYEKDPVTNNNSVKSFLTFLDKFPNVICATTSEEYEKFIKNDAPVLRRLMPVKIEPLKPEEMMIALYKYLHLKAPELIVEENPLKNEGESQNAIAYIIEKALAFNPKTSKIDAAISLLKSAIVKATHITFNDLEKSINDLKLKIEYLENLLLHSDGADSAIHVNQYKQKQKDLKKAQDKLSIKKNALKQVKKIESISLKLKNQGYQLAVKADSESANIPKKWLVNYAKHQVITDFLLKERNDLGLPSGINKALIDDIIAQKY